jgi:hypothetical protein
MTHFIDETTGQGDCFGSRGSPVRVRPPRVSEITQENADFRPPKTGDFTSPDVLESPHWKSQKAGKKWGSWKRPRPVPEATPEARARFMSRIETGAPDECWRWKGFTTPKGYGSISIAGKSLPAHRVSLAWLKGERLLAGLVIDHRCGNRACVNPAHLEQVSAGTNALRSETGPSAVNARKTRCKWGHDLAGENLVRVTRQNRASSARRCLICLRLRYREYRARKRAAARAADGRGVDSRKGRLSRTQIMEIRAKYEAREDTHEQIARQYGIAPATVGAIGQRKIWRRI